MTGEKIAATSFKADFLVNFFPLQAIARSV